MIVIIDPGHGGFDPGGGSNKYWKEKDLNLKISKYMYNRFRELGIKTALTRYGDITLTPNERINVVKSLAAGEPTGILISNHINNGGGKGAEIIYSIFDQPTLGRLIAREIEATGQNIRNVYTRINSVGQDYYFIIRETRGLESIIVEYGFADNPIDTEILLYQWPVLAEAVVRGVANYLGVPYTPPSYTLYIVRPNDSLYKIAQAYNTTVAKLKIDNNLTSDTIYVGQELYIYDRTF